MKRNMTIAILACALTASIFAGQSNVNEDVDEFIERLKSIILTDEDEGYMQAITFFNSQDIEKRIQYARAILERVAYDDFGGDSRMERYMYRISMGSLRRDQVFDSDKESGKLLYRIFLHRPDIAGRGVPSAFYEMNKPEKIHIGKLEKELMAGRAEILLLAIIWDIKDLEGVTKDILRDESESWGTREVRTVDGPERRARRIRIFGNRFFKIHDRCAELGDANIAPPIFVDVVDLAKAYLGWAGNEKYIAELEQSFFDATSRDVSEISDNYDEQIYYYSLLYSIGHPPDKRPLSENDTGLVIPGFGPISIDR